MDVQKEKLSDNIEAADLLKDILIMRINKIWWNGWNVMNTDIMNVYEMNVNGCNM